MNKPNYPEEIILKINVTHDDIDNGLRKDSEACPIALATARAVKALYGDALETLEVDGDISFVLDGYHYKQQNPISAIGEFTAAFDVEDYVGPIELEVRFEIEIPDDHSDDWDYGV